MLKLKNIVKEYVTGDTTVKALRGISLDFRENEFVSILGQSGCGKTTLLNIIGGLDRYTSGDLFISGVSTKKFKDRDWDSYRNHSVGFVFQNYNLIPHQTVLANVELALTLAGISKSERRKRATEVLQKVGLGDQLDKKPNQMSGGQMQRVAIARALVNNPEILLADEPTGALDSQTSVQIMELLKEIAQDHLVIMVTHNPELAEQYSTRIIRLLDGEVKDDSNPYEETLSENETTSKEKKISMSFFTALSLSMNNLMTKKGRTFLTSFAGSIGIIGIALILSLSSGMQAYISNMEENTLSSYPIAIERQTNASMAGMGAMFNRQENKIENKSDDMVYSSNTMTRMLKSMTAQISRNDLKQFKNYLDSPEGAALKDQTLSIRYSYPIDLQLFKEDTSEEVFQVNPSTFLDKVGFNQRMENSPFGADIWQELLDNPDLLQSQYDVLAGAWPVQDDEMVLIVNEDNEISDTLLYSIGLLDSSAVEKTVEKLKKGEAVDSEMNSDIAKFNLQDILDLKFKLIRNTDRYQKTNGIWKDQSENTLYMKNVVDNGTTIKIVGVLRPKKNANLARSNGYIGYKHELSERMIAETANSEIVKDQQATPDVDVFTGKPFAKEDEPLTMDGVKAYMATRSPEEQAQMQQMMASMSEEEILTLFTQQLKKEEKATYDGNLKLLQVADLDSPSEIQLYPKSFESKEKLETAIKDYNTQQQNDGHEEYMISYTDLVGLMMSSVSSIINIITYVLVAFVAISLVVSSIMIGIITYISVLERTKEIGILRSIGASKRDISRVFNAETLLVGLVAGLMGIGITVLLNIPINIIIESITKIGGISVLPAYGAVALVGISMFLTVLAGLIPAKMAAKKDPVVALRSE